MLYRAVPKTGDELSALGFGCMRLPTKRGQIDEARARAQIRTAIDQGVNYLDTAVPYHGGNSEPFVGRIIAEEGIRQRVRVATKLPPWNALSKADLDRLLSAQLERLGTDRIDYYLLHSLNRRVWRKLQRFEVEAFLDRAKKQGRIINAGFSFHGAKNDFPDILDGYDWDFCQLQWNFLDENTQAGRSGLELAASKGIGVIAMEPLRGGDLSSKIPSQVEALWQEAPIQRSPAEWALRWVWNHPGVTSVLSGMNEEAHIEENLRIAGEASPGSLSEEELDLVGRVRDVYLSFKRTGCTACNYCMPCPEGVDIPRCFELYDDVFLFPDNRWLRFRYPLQVGGIMSEPAHAGLCTACGKCKKKCPQELPIPDLLAEVNKELDRAWMKPLLWLGRHAIALQRRRLLKRS